MNRRLRSPPSTGRIAAWGAGMALAVSVLMILTPAAMGTSAGLTIHKPFKTLPQSSSYSVSVSGCGKAKTPLGPKFTPKTGVFKIEGQATAPACKLHPGQQSYADWDGSWNTQGPFFFKSNGTHSVAFNWKMTASNSWTIPAFTCALNYAAMDSECYASAQVFVIVLAQVFDQTNFTQFTSTSSTPVSNSSYQDNFSQRACGTCSPSGGNFSGGPGGSWSGSVTGSTIVNMTGVNSIANKSNTYNMYFTLIAIADVSAYTINAGSSSPVTASAQMNMATLGNEFVLGSIVIS